MANYRRVGKPWRTDPEVLERLRQVEPLHLRRLSGRQIAARLGVSEATIREDLKRLAQLWRERIQGEQAQLRAQIVAELDDTRERALAAAEWDEACERAVLFDTALPADLADAVGGRRAGRVWRDHKGAAQFRGQKAAALNVARQATMDKAKVLGVIESEPVGEIVIRRYVGVPVEDV